MDYCRNIFYDNNDLGLTGLDKVKEISDITNIENNQKIISTDDLNDVYQTKSNNSIFKWIDLKNDVRGYIDVITSVDLGNQTNIEGIVYLHGGGFIQYDPIIYRNLTYRLNKKTNLPVFCLDYPLVNSESDIHYDEVMRYILSSLEYLITKKHVSKIHLMGDSSGATLAIQFINYLIRSDNKHKLLDNISTMVLFSPWIDLECQTPSYKTREFCPSTKTGDPIFTTPTEKTIQDSQQAALLYLGKNSVEDHNPIKTPLEYFQQYPPTLLFVGDDETIRDDTITFLGLAQQAKKLNIYGIIYNQMWHVWIQYSQGCGGQKRLKQADDALEKTNTFIKSRGTISLKELEMNSGMSLVNVGVVM